MQTIICSINLSTTANIERFAMSKIIYTYQALQSRYGHIFQITETQGRLESPSRVLQENTPPSQTKQGRSSSKRYGRREALSHICESQQEYQNQYIPSKAHVSDVQFVKDERYTGGDCARKRGIGSENVVPGFPPFYRMIANDTFESVEPSYSIEISLAVMAGHPRHLNTPRESPIIFETTQPPETWYTSLEDSCWKTSDGDIVFRCSPPCPVFGIASKNGVRSSKNFPRKGEKGSLIEQHAGGFPVSSPSRKAPRAGSSRLDGDSPQRKFLFPR